MKKETEEKRDKIEDWTAEEVREARRVLGEIYPEIDNWTGEEIATQCRYMREGKGKLES